MAIRDLSARAGDVTACAAPAVRMPLERAEARNARRVVSGTASDFIVEPSGQRPPGTGKGRTQETCVMNRFSAAKQTAVVVANRGVGCAGKVAMVASPTRITSKSCDRFLYPAVVEQTHISVLYPANRTCRTPCLLRKSRRAGYPSPS